MNQEKIGKFIQEMRKQKGLTQEELAEKLNVSNKTISRWENGVNLPDASLYNSLCKELNISINELLSGQKLDKNDYQNRLEENVILLNDKTNKELKKHLKITIMIIILLMFIPIIIGFIYFKMKDYKDNKKIYYNIADVHIEVCEYKPNTSESQIFVKSTTNNGLESVIESKINDNHELIIRNFRYEKWNKEPELAHGFNKISLADRVNKVYYDKKLIWDNSRPLPECIESKGLTKTFDIDAKEKSGSLDETYITIKKCDTNEKYNVFVKENFANNIQVGKTYEFTFNYSMTTFLNNKNDVREIFEQLQLLSVKETNKICQEQINDEIF